VADEHERQEKAKVRKEQLEKLRHLLQVGGHEAETEYVQLLKDWKPDITKTELAARIKQFHDAVSERQSRDRESR
jgi:threonyl-tRNA synthetase